MTVVHLKILPFYRTKWLKFALFALAATFFGAGITEFISVGVLPAIGNEFNISISTAGLITSMYALGVAVGGLATDMMGLEHTPWVASIMVLLGVLLTLVTIGLEKKQKIT